MKKQYTIKEKIAFYEAKLKELRKHQEPDQELIKQMEQRIVDLEENIAAIWDDVKALEKAKRR